MRAAPLTVLKGGINRQRTKGGARADSLYDLVNGHLTDDGTVRSRPGTLRVTQLNPLTKGLMSFDGQLCTFCHTTVSVPDGYRLYVLLHPDSASGDVPLEKIHFSVPFLGAPYVVAEFENGDVHHYWLQEGEEWSAATVYKSTSIVRSIDDNGITYAATRLSPPLPSWTPNTARAEGDQVEPTVYNDFFYEVTDTEGDNPVSGATEPVWPTEEGQTVVEDTAGVTSNVPTVTGAPTAQQPNPQIQERYDYSVSVPTP